MVLKAPGAILSSLEFIAGPGRVIAGFGIGTFDHEFNVDLCGASAEKLAQLDDGVRVRTAAEHRGQLILERNEGEFERAVGGSNSTTSRADIAFQAEVVGTQPTSLSRRMW